MNKLTLREYFKAFKVKTALKLVLAGIICILINNILHFDLGYFSALFSFLILVLFHGEALKVGSQALVGCVISGSVSLLLICSLNLKFLRGLHWELPLNGHKIAQV